MKKSSVIFAGIALSALICTGCGNEEKSESAASSSSSTAPAAGGAAIPAVQARNAGRQVNYDMELKQIGTGITMYTVDHNDNMPATLADIASYCAGMDLSSFVYIGNIGRMPVNAANVPVAFVKPQLCTGDRLPVLMSDGHVDTVTVSGLSGKNIRQITEEITSRVSDAAIKSKLRDNASRL